MSRIIEPFEQFFDGAGDPLTNGWLLFLQSGSVSTEKDTYYDSSETVANTNPVQLDAEGRCPNVFGSGTYKVVLYTNDDLLNEPLLQIQSKDPVGGTTTASFNDWNSAAVYNVSDVVKGSDNEFYESISAANQGNDPTAAETYWKRVGLNDYWNSTITYNAGDRVIDIDDNLDYKALLGSNLNQQPSESPTYWTTMGVPAYCAMLWLKPISEIPPGWHICDGTNGTPDMTDLFVLHADADSGGTNDVGDTGGSNKIVSANLPTHTHDDGTLATDTEPDHAHNLDPYGSFGSVATTGSVVGLIDGYTSVDTSDSGSHAHDVTGSTGDGGFANSDFRPKYICYPWIMKL